MKKKETNTFNTKYILNGNDKQSIYVNFIKSVELLEWYWE